MGEQIPGDANIITNPPDKTLIAYAVGSESLQLVVAPRGRAWMDHTAQHFANRCLPLLMANQSGWFLITKRDIEVVWNGGQGKESLLIKDLSGAAGHCPAVSIFGHGILTWHIPYLFRTPPGYNLLVRGPANWPKEDVYALEGLVETDWAVATFTMNYKMMRANTVIRFSAGEPVCMIVPQRRGELETFSPAIQSIETAPSEHEGYKKWSASRGEFNRSLASGVKHPPNQQWQKHYVRGGAPDGRSSDEHQIKRSLTDFESTNVISPRLSYIICTSPRSGSSLLSQALESTHIAGRPIEFFDPNQQIEMGNRRQYGAELDTCGSYIQKILQKTTSENGVFGMKLHWHQFNHLCRQLNRSTDLAGLSAWFPNIRCIWLRRKDRVRQAVSYARAAQSNIWWQVDGMTTNPTIPLQFDQSMIDARFRDLEKHEAAWERLFAESKITPLEIWYEEFVEDYENTIKAVLKYLDIAFPENLVLPKPRLRRQSDEVSEEWVQRYLSGRQDD